MIKELWPIYIPSRGRAFTCRTPVDLPASFLVVEPSEVADYAKRFGVERVIPLPKDKFGLANVRNFILDLGGAHPFWMIDDDIQSWHLVQKSRLWPCAPRECLLEAQKILEGKLWDVAGLEYAFCAWALAEKHPLIWDSYAEVVWAFKTVRRQVRFDPGIPAKEDRDFVIGLLASGGRSVRVTSCSFKCPKNGSNRGGLYDVYQSGREEEACRALENKWPGVCKTVRKKNGRWDVKINWSVARESKSGNLEH